MAVHCSRLVLPRSALRECLHATSSSALRGCLCASLQPPQRSRLGCHLWMSTCSSRSGVRPLRVARSHWRGGVRVRRWAIAGGCGHRDRLAQIGDRWLATLGSEFDGRTSSRNTIDTASANALLLSITEFDSKGNHVTRVARKSELLAQYGIQARDIRFSTSSSLFVRSSSIILRLQHIKAIINCDSLILLDSDHPAMQQFIPEIEERLRAAVSENSLSFEFHVLETMLLKMFTVLDARLQELSPALTEVLNSLLDPQLFSIDRGHLHILLHHSKSLSEFHSLVRDIEATLSEVLDQEEDMADMYLTHWGTTGEDREVDDIEEINNILEAYLMQAENIMSEIQKLRELINQSESIILINLDSQRNVMLRLGLQLEMGMFSATICGLLGMAFGMNLDSSLEEHPYAFWVITGLMFTTCGLLWRRLLMFLGKNLDRSPIKRLVKPKSTAQTLHKQ